MSLADYLFLKIYTIKSGLPEIHKKPRARTLMDSQHAKGSKRLLKSAGQYFVIFFDHS